MNKPTLSKEKIELLAEQIHKKIVHDMEEITDILSYQNYYIVIAYDPSDMRDHAVIINDGKNKKRFYSHRDDVAERISRFIAIKTLKQMHQSFRKKIYTVYEHHYTGYGGLTETSYVLMKNNQETDLHFDDKSLAEKVAAFIETEVRPTLPEEIKNELLKQAKNISA